jgi:hypothetical protein
MCEQTGEISHIPSTELFFFLELSSSIVRWRIMTSIHVSIVLALILTWMNDDQSSIVSRGTWRLPV